MLQKTLQITKQSALFAGAFVLALASLQIAILNQHVYAAQITNRTLTLSSSSAAAASATTSYTLTFTVPSATVVQSFDMEICQTASGACTTPTGFSSASSTITQPTNLGDASGWTVDTGDSGKLALTKTGNVAAPVNPVTVTFNNVQNPTTPNETFFGRMTTYSDDSYSAPVDTGVVAASTDQDIYLTGIIDETLVFCTGISITGTNCATVAGSTVNFGTLSSTVPSSGTSVMAASTNGVSGYAITINGSTLTCTTCSGSPTIAALAAQTASSPGSAQFGANLVANATPSVGANPANGNGSPSASYNTANSFRFVTGDSVATAGNAVDANRYTVSYLVNIPGSQPAGTYTSTMTFIATSTF